MSSSRLSSILLIDDDEISNLFNKIFIGKLNLDIDVAVALNGAEALEILSGKTENGDDVLLKPCLVLLDIRMPIMNGWEFLKAYDQLVDQETKGQTVIILTTSEDQSGLIKAFDNPYVKEIIKKPLSENNFRMLINKFFAKEKTL